MKLLKKYSKWIVYFALIFTLLFSNSFIANAHSGRTDELGGHFVSKTGEYHFHSYKALAKNAKSKQNIINLIVQNNTSAKNYYVTKNSINWNSYYTIYSKKLK